MSEGANPRASEGWTDAQRAELFRLRDEEGLSISEIAGRLGRTYSAAHDALKRGPTLKGRPHSPTWPSGNVEAVRRMWLEGRSSGQIAAALGVTRNAIVGKVARLGLTRSSGTPQRKPPWRAPVAESAPQPKPIYAAVCQPNPPFRKAGAPERKAETPKCPPTAPECKPEPAAKAAPAPTLRCEPVALLDLAPHHCRYPFGTTDFRFCGISKSQREPYCINHMKLTHTTVGLRKLYAVA